MRIAIVGGGLAGTALAYFLQEHEVTLFDRGDGASRIAAGLLHTRPGKDRRLSERADEAMRQSEALLALAGWPCHQGLIRDGEEVHGYTVFCVRYLEKLRALTTLVEREEGFDRVVYCLGYGMRHVPFDLPLRYVKGQVLSYRLEAPLEKSRIGDGYVALSEDPGVCFLGSTYEHNFVSAKGDIEEAKRIILPKVGTFFPPLTEQNVLSSQCGVRVCNRHHYRPIAKEVRPGVYVLTALGSRGLLYHALYAKELAHEIHLSRHRRIDGSPYCRLPLSCLPVGAPA